MFTCTCSSLTSIISPVHLLGCQLTQNFTNKFQVNSIMKCYYSIIEQDMNTPRVFMKHSVTPSVICVLLCSQHLNSLSKQVRLSEHLLDQLWQKESGNQGCTVYQTIWNRLYKLCKQIIVHWTRNIHSRACNYIFKCTCTMKVMGHTTIKKII